MSQFFGVVRHEFNMCLRRPGLWIAYLVLYAFYAVSVFAPSPSGETGIPPVNELWQYAGQILFYGNMFMVVLGGILAADRMQRDFRLRVRELQQSAPLRVSVYILAKYFGTLAGVLAPMLVWVILIAAATVVGGAPVEFIGIMLVVFLAMGVPAHAFVVAFSLACPLVMPVRVYQILFTGYWFWGNYFNSKAFPTLSGTLLVPSGQYVLDGFFGGFPAGSVQYPAALHTPVEAVLNLMLLALCIVAVLVTLNLYLRRQAQRA